MQAASLARNPNQPRPLAGPYNQIPQEPPPADVPFFRYRSEGSLWALFTPALTLAQKAFKEALVLQVNVCLEEHPSLKPFFLSMVRLAQHHENRRRENLPLDKDTTPYRRTATDNALDATFFQSFQIFLRELPLTPAEEVCAFTPRQVDLSRSWVQHRDTYSPWFHTRSIRHLLNDLGYKWYQRWSLLSSYHDVLFDGDEHGDTLFHSTLALPAFISLGPQAQQSFVTYLLKSPARSALDIKNRYGQTPVMVACALAYSNTVGELWRHIQTLPADRIRKLMNDKDSNGRTPLMYASHYRDANFIRRFFLQAKDINVQINWTARDVDGHQAHQLMEGDDPELQLILRAIIKEATYYDPPLTLLSQLELINDWQESINFEEMGIATDHSTLTIPMPQGL